jgi:hypothetical protein
MNSKDWEGERHGLIAITVHLDTETLIYLASRLSFGPVRLVTISRTISVHGDDAVLSQN